MLIRGQIDGISGEVAQATATIPAARPTLLIGGLLLTCPEGRLGICAWALRGLYEITGP